MPLDNQYSTFARTDSGDLEMPLRIVRGAEAIRIKLVDRLSIFKGGWYLDKRIGVPYLEHILVHSPDLDLVEAIFRRVILNTPGVARIITMDINFDAAQRQYIISNLYIILIDQTPLRDQPDEFIVVVPDLN